MHQSTPGIRALEGHVPAFLALWSGLCGLRAAARGLREDLAAQVQR